MKLYATPEMKELTESDLKASATKPRFRVSAIGTPATSRRTKIRSTDQKRIDAITNIAARYLDRHPDRVDDVERIGRAAIQGTVAPAEFEIQLNRALMPSATAEPGPKIIEAAICRTLSLENIDRHFDARVLEATEKHFRNRISLQELLLIAACRNGYRSHSARDVDALLQAAFPPRRIQASGGFSTFSLSGILSNTLNRLMLAYFTAVESAWREIAAIRPVSDLRTVTSYSLTGDAQYEKVGPAGEIKHATLGEQSYTNKADTYARMLAITRHDIINDDLGALQAVPQRLGRGGALKLNDVFWSAFLNNATFFSSGNNNVSTGGGSALGTADGAAINAAELVFRNQTDPDGKQMGVMPRIILVPPTLLNTAARWMGGQLIVTGANDTLPNLNVYQGRFKVVSSSYLENSTYTGYSTAAWYLLADPNDVPVIEIVFLKGRDVPFIDSADADFNTLGIQVRGYHDFGVALQEPRGGVRSAGN